MTRMATQPKPLAILAAFLMATAGLQAQGLGPGGTAVNNWHYRLTPRDDGTDVTESFRLIRSPLISVFRAFGGFLRERRNLRDMRTTLERIKSVVEEQS
jgi:hypothetical protein